jgi:hypothetical protein
MRGWYGWWGWIVWLLLLKACWFEEKEDYLCWYWEVFSPCTPANSKRLYPICEAQSNPWRTISYFEISFHSQEDGNLISFKRQRYRRLKERQPRSFFPSQGGLGIKWGSEFQKASKKKKEDNPDNGNGRQLDTSCSLPARGSTYI